LNCSADSVNVNYVLVWFFLRTTNNSSTHTAFTAVVINMFN